MTIFFVIDYIDEQNSPQALGVVQHQAPDTTSPSPPHQYSTNGNTSATVGSFSSTMLPQGKGSHRVFFIKNLFFSRRKCSSMGSISIGCS
jgi:hypothetical protein